MTSCITSNNYQGINSLRHSSNPPKKLAGEQFLSSITGCVSSRGALALRCPWTALKRTNTFFQSSLVSLQPNLGSLNELSFQPFSSRLKTTWAMRRGLKSPAGCGDWYKMWADFLLIRILPCSTPASFLGLITPFHSSCPFKLPIIRPCYLIPIFRESVNCNAVATCLFTRTMDVISVSQI